MAATENTNPRTARGVARRDNDGKTPPDSGRSTLGIEHHHDSAPLLDWWLIGTESYTGSHYATWPRALCVPAIKAMCPAQVCTICGESRRRITKPTDDYTEHLGSDMFGDSRVRRNGSGNAHISASRDTVGWTDCGCAGGDARWRRGVVLDPFAGSGTTLAVATGLGRDAIGIDLDDRNVDLAYERVGMFLTVEASS